MRGYGMPALAGPSSTLSAEGPTVSRSPFDLYFFRLSVPSDAADTRTGCFVKRWRVPVCTAGYANHSAGLLSSVNVGARDSRQPHDLARSVRL